MSSVVHFITGFRQSSHGGSRYYLYPLVACGAHSGSDSSTRARDVTCRACKRTGAYSKEK